MLYIWVVSNLLCQLQHENFIFSFHELSFNQTLPNSSIVTFNDYTELGPNVESIMNSFLSLVVLISNVLPQQLPVKIVVACRIAYI